MMFSGFMARLISKVPPVCKSPDNHNPTRGKPPASGVRGVDCVEVLAVPSEQKIHAVRGCERQVDGICRDVGRKDLLLKKAARTE